MTGYTVHTGSTEKFATGWDQIFGGKPASGGGKKKKPAKQTEAAKKKSAKNKK